MANRPWRVIIDGWVRDPKIRRDALIGLVLLLATLVIIAAIAFSSGATVLGSLLATIGPVERSSWAPARLAQLARLA